MWSGQEVCLWRDYFKGIYNFFTSSNLACMFYTKLFNYYLKAKKKRHMESSNGFKYQFNINHIFW